MCFQLTSFAKYFDIITYFLLENQTLAKINHLTTENVNIMHNYS